jgi:8-oxo-dGTP pyrophosphatase MutT (NUDIX family)
MPTYPTFEISITAIVHKDGRYLITKRSMNKKRFPGKWTVPGGHLEPNDFTSHPKDTDECWYNVLEKALAREVKEEVGLEIENVRYVTSLAVEDKSGTIPIVISCLADYKCGEVLLDKQEATESAWVTVIEAKNYDLIGGILHEFLMADALRKGERIVWKGDQ